MQNTQKKRVLCTGITSIHAWPAYTLLQQNPSIELYGIKPPKASTPTGAHIFSASLGEPEKYREIFNQIKPTHVLHAAGVCDLDACEADPERAYRINVEGAKLIAELSANAYLLYCSADLVFSGNTRPESGYDESHLPDPVSVVGKSYACAEKEIESHPNAAILRLGLPMGDSIQGYKGAVDFIESRFKRDLPVTLFYDEYRSAIHTDDVGKMITELLLNETTGLYHAGGTRAVSLYEMGEVIAAYKPHYKKELLSGRFTHEDTYGPPRVKNIHMNSSKLYAQLGWTPKEWPLNPL